MKNRKSKEKEKIWIKYCSHTLNTKFGQSLKRLPIKRIIIFCKRKLLLRLFM